MSRGLLVAVVLAVVTAPAAPVAARAAKTTKVAKTGATKSKAGTKKRVKRTKRSKKRVVKKHQRKRGRLAKATRKPRPRVKTTSKPLVKVATLQSDGRVRYGPDRLPPGFAWPPTKQMQSTSKACEQALDALGITWKPAPPQHKVVDPIVVPAMEFGGIKYTSAFRRRGAPTMDCQFAHALAKLGPELYAIGVREVRYGSVVRNTLARSHGQTKDFLSRHALGIAMDIRSFVDAEGRVATVETDYLKADPLLHGIEDLINDRVTFRQVLTPANDPISHDDHFHIEASVDFTTFR